MIISPKMIERAKRLPADRRVVWEASIARHATVHADGQVEVKDIWTWNAIVFALREGRVLEVGEVDETKAPAAEIVARPVSEWPMLARLVAKAASCRDAGVGDTVARCLHLVGADSIAKAYELITGQECGCGDRQAKLNAMYPYPADLTIDCGNCGHGDVVLAAWIADGHRREGRRVKLLAPGHHQEMARMLGQGTATGAEGVVLKIGNGTKSYAAELKGGSREPRAMQWQAELPWRSRPLRPAVQIPEREMDAVDAFLKTHNAQRRPVVVIYPMSAQSARRWPLSLWIDLAFRISPAACVIALDGQGSAEVQGFPLYAYGMSWGWQAALIRRAAVVLGNDSAGAHLAGTLGVPTIAAMGPTRAEVVFGHMPQSVTVVTGEASCTGCHFGKPYNAGCDRGCRSLMLLEVGQMLWAAGKYLSETLMVDPAWRPVAQVEGHRYTSDEEAGILAGLIEAKECRRVLEIGTADGRTARQVLGACAPIEKWVAMDVREDAGQLASGEGRYELQVRVGSEIPAGEWDCVFVDGDHAYGPAMADSLAAIATGAGLIVWHDAGNVAEVDQVLWDLRAKGHRIRHVAGSRLAVLDRRSS